MKLSKQTVKLLYVSCMIDESCTSLSQVPGVALFFHSLQDRSMKYVCENLVKPLTKEVRLSYAELVGAHQVQWFISHFWGTSFQHFTEAVGH